MAVSVEVDAAEHGDSIYEHRSLIVIETRGPPDNDDGGTR
jgi:hypothetical protein